MCRRPMPNGEFASNCHPLNRFHSIMDEAAEQQDQVAEIDRLVATTIDATDTDELEAELEALVGEELPKVPVNVDVDLPSVPQDQLDSDVGQVREEEKRQALEAN